MQSIRLVTFDIFGTLLDWQSYVQQAFPGRYAEFREASLEYQKPADPTFPYRKLLYEVGLGMSPRASREALSFFADGLGFAPAFNDSRSIQLLSHMTMIGVLSNCDLRHLLDVQRALGVVFDVAAVSEELGAYKPHGEAWDAIFDLVTRKYGFDRQSWLHVSGYTESDLIPAKERGIQTCFVPRPGGASCTEASALQCTYEISDLWQLTQLVAEINGTPIRHVVRVNARDKTAAAEFAHWMRYEHGPAMLEIKGCQSFQILQLSSTEMLCEYTFTHKSALDEYLHGHASDMQHKGRSQFDEAKVSFQTYEGQIQCGYEKRCRSDFMAEKKSS